MNDIVTLDQVFQNRVFCVPDYQRGYAWEARQLDDLLEDLEEMREAKDHYTGTLVLHRTGAFEEDEEGVRYERVEVVDGQQRLTTLVILLSVVARALAGSASTALATGLRRRFVATRDAGGQPFYKLRLSGELQPWFTQAVLADTSTTTASSELAAQRRLLAARTRFSEYVDRQRTRPDFVDWLQDLSRKVTTRLRLSVYPVGNEAEVGVIFEVMNNRGRPLTEMEKVKNHLLYLASRLSVPSEGLRDLVNRAWAAIYRRLEAVGLGAAEYEDQLLRAHWIATADPDVRRWEGSRSIKQRFQLKAFRGLDAERDLLARLTEYARTLGDAVVPFVDAHRPTAPGAFGAFVDPAHTAESRRWGDKITRMWAIAPFLPLLIATRLRAPQDGAETAALLCLLERYAFRIYRWGEMRSHTGQSTLYVLAHKRFRDELDSAALCAQIRGLLQRYNSEAAFEAQLQEQPRDEDNNWFAWSGIRYFLYEWEEHCAAPGAVQVPWQTLSKEELAKTVEHILPQSPADPAWRHFTVADRARYTHDIGNLVLTAYNPSLGAKGFSAKKGAPGQARCYATSQLKSEQRLAALSEWDVATLKARRAEIVAWARERWAVTEPPATSVEVVADDEDEDSR